MTQKFSVQPITKTTKIVEPALAYVFLVEIDGLDVAVFSACEGLTAEYELTELKEGGQNAFQHRLPGRIKLGNIKLTRGVDDHSGKIAAWFMASAAGGDKTGHITAYDGWYRPIARWELQGVWPVKYTGPTFNTTTAGVATEILELVHTGFTYQQP